MPYGADRFVFVGRVTLPLPVLTEIPTDFETNFFPLETENLSGPGREEDYILFQFGVPLARPMSGKQNFQAQTPAKTQASPTIWKHLRDCRDQPGQSSGVQRELSGVWNPAPLLQKKYILAITL